MKKLFKRNLSLSLVFAFILSIMQFNTLTVFADTSNFIIDSNGVLTKYNGAGGDVAIPDGVKSIGKMAFESCIHLTSIAIPNSVISIGNRAFESCINLTSITIPYSIINIDIEAFRNCTSLTSLNVDLDNKQYSSEDGVLFNKNKTTLIQYPIVKLNNSYTIPSGVINIADGAFFSSKNLININIPNTVTNISASSISYCNKLTNINVNLDNKQYLSQDGILFNKDKTTLIQYPLGNANKVYNIPDGVTSIGNNAFGGSTSLTSITIPNSVTSMGDEAFGWCTSLTSITIPSSVRSIGNSEFAYCRSLTSITILNGLTSIGDDVFEGCNKLISVTMPNTVTSIGNYDFLFCTCLTSVTIPKNVINIGSKAFDYCKNLTIYGEPNSYAQTFAQAENIPFKSVFENPDALYSIVYSAVSTAISSKSQKSINDSSTAIATLQGTGAAWAIGEFSKQVDQVQQPILVNICNAIDTAQSSLKQADINAAKAAIDLDLPAEWKNSYSSAVDAIQQKLIDNVIAAHNKAVATKAQADIDTENALIKDIETATDSSVVQWVDTHVKASI